MRTILFHTCNAVALTCVAVLACGKAVVGDEQPLRTLSSSELGELCDEVQEGWSSADEAIACDDGSRVTFSRPPRGTCGDVDFSGCPATVGELRACDLALLDDPCSAARQLPEACERLERAGCGEANAGAAIASICPEAPADQVAAVEGVYELVSRRGSDQSCAGEGDALALGSERWFVLVAGSVFGREAGVLQSCPDVSTCLRRATELREQLGSTDVTAVTALEYSPELQHSFLCRAPSPGALLAQLISVGAQSDGNCELSATDTTLTRAADGTLRLESRTFAWQKPVVDDGCEYVAGERPDSTPCSALEVSEARFVTAL
jgi:hypothetical protein